MRPHPLKQLPIVAMNFNSFNFNSQSGDKTDLELDWKNVRSRKEQYIDRLIPFYNNLIAIIQPAGTNCSNKSSQLLFIFSVCIRAFPSSIWL